MALTTNVRSTSASNTIDHPFRAKWNSNFVYRSEFSCLDVFVSNFPQWLTSFKGTSSFVPPIIKILVAFLKLVFNYTGYGSTTDSFEHIV